MKGSVRKRGKTWSYRIDLGKNSDQRAQIEKGGYKTKREADKALADALYQINNTGDYVENQKITFSQVFSEFMETEAPATRGVCNNKTLQFALQKPLCRKIWIILYVSNQPQYDRRFSQREENLSK